MAAGFTCTAADVLVFCKRYVEDDVELVEIADLIKVCSIRGSDVRPNKTVKRRVYYM